MGVILMELAAFLTARLDDDEKTAKAAFGPGVALNWPAVHPAVDAFIDRYSPLRVVREVNAKRAILTIHEPVPFWGNNPPPYARRTTQNVRAWYCECQAPDGVIEGEWPCPTVRALAAVYSDHPDYNPEWK
jgi:hypothetical protein